MSSPTLSPRGIYLFEVPESSRTCLGGIKTAVIPAGLCETCFQAAWEPWFWVSEEVLASGSWSVVCKMIRMTEHKNYSSVTDKHQ